MLIKRLNFHMWAIAMHNYTLLNNNFKKNQKLQ